MSKRCKKLLIALAAYLMISMSALVVYVSASDINWLDVNFKNTQTQAYLGESIILPDAQPVYPQKVKSYYYVVESPDGKTVSLEDNTFVAELEGDYTVYICVVGYENNSYSENFTISVEKSTAPILVEKPVFPVAFLEGSKYSVPVAKFVDYNTASPSVVDYKVYVINASGDEIEVGEEYYPEAEVHGESVKFKYVAASSVTNQSRAVTFEEICVLKPFEVNEYDERVYDYSKMFVVNNAENVVAARKGVKFYATQDFSLSYANFLHADLSVSMMSEQNLTNFDSVKFTITDAYDENQCVTFKFKAINDKSSHLTVNDKETFTAKGSIKNYNSGLSFSFSNSTLRFFDAESKLITTINKTFSGKEFSGFSSQLIRLKVEVNGLSGRSVFEVNDINGHGMNLENDGIDATLPYVFPEKDFVYKNGVGDLVLLPKAVAVDVIDPSIIAVVSVYDPKGNVVKDKNGLELYEVEATIDYEFKVEEIGVYTIQYQAEDVNWNSYNYGYYSLFVLDNQSPTIKTKSTISPSVNVGGKLTMPKVECSDNVTLAKDIVVFVTISGGVQGVKYAKPGESVTFGKAGIYHIRFTAIDGNNNFTTIEYVVECK